MGTPLAYRELLLKRSAEHGDLVVVTRAERRTIGHRARRQHLEPVGVHPLFHRLELCARFDNLLGRHAAKEGTQRLCKTHTTQAKTLNRSPASQRTLSY